LNCRNLVATVISSPSNPLENLNSGERIMSHNLTYKTAQTTTQATTPSDRLEAISIPSQTIEQPSAWMNQGTSPAELILAIAYILIAQSLVNWSIAGIIYVLKGKGRSYQPTQK
jgi:hypothetical protein